jgi:uncharacterized protein
VSASTNPLARHGGLSYLHIAARDPERSAAFYERVLGWTIERRGDGAFRFSAGDRLLIGGFGGDQPGSSFVPWFYVDGLDAAIERVTASGGRIVDPPRVAGDIRVVEIHDPGKIGSGSGSSPSYSTPHSRPSLSGQSPSARFRSPNRCVKVGAI